MSSDGIDHLGDLDNGDEIEVSERETPMEVTGIAHLRKGAVVIEAKNHHGRYRLRQHLDGSVSFRAGGKIVSGDVEVARHV